LKKKRQHGRQGEEAPQATGFVDTGWFDDHVRFFGYKRFFLAIGE